CAAMSASSPRNPATALRPALSPTWCQTLFREVRGGLQMHRDFGIRCAVLLVGASLSAAVIALITSNPSHSQSVELRWSDGSVPIPGPLMRFDGNAYTIKSGAHRELRLPVSDFLCISASCPGPNAFGIHGSNTIGAELMPRL